MKPAEFQASTSSATKPSWGPYRTTFSKTPILSWLHFDSYPLTLTLAHTLASALTGVGSRRTLLAVLLHVCAVHGGAEGDTSLFLNKGSEGRPNIGKEREREKESVGYRHFVSAQVCLFIFKVKAAKFERIKFRNTDFFRWKYFYFVTNSARKNVVQVNLLHRGKKLLHSDSKNRFVKRRLQPSSKIWSDI